MARAPFNKLLREIRACNYCADYLRVRPKPVVQLDPRAKILIIAQAPGRRASQSGRPFDDSSGDRLRLWLQVSRELFYDESKMAFMPMGFCYPGVSAGGDLAPCKECAPIWHPYIIPELRHIELTLLIGSYAQEFYINNNEVGKAVKNWRAYLPLFLPLPHPSWHNNAWLMKNLWFENELLPYLRERIKNIFNE